MGMEREPQRIAHELGAGCCGRQNTADMLRDDAKRLVAEAAQLNELADQVRHLTPGADEALWSAMCRGRR